MIAERHSRPIALIFTLTAVLGLGTQSTWSWGQTSTAAKAAPAPDSAPDSEIPASYAPFEHLIGGWKGTAIPQANRLRGWRETHRWGWKFVKGQPQGLTLSIEGGKTIAQGFLAFDSSKNTYRLEAQTPEKVAVTYVGSLDDAGKVLTLERTTSTPEGKERLVVRLLPDNKIRYLMWVEKQPEGALRFTRSIEVGLTKEGETFAAAGGGSDGPKCVVTGGSASMSVTHEGKTYPLCCSGCLEEFKENPEKYVKKAALMASKAASGETATAPRPKSGDDSELEGLVGGSAKAKTNANANAKAKSAGRGMPGKSAETRKAPPSGKGSSPAETPESAPTEKSADKAGNRAASFLQLGLNLEKSGKIDAALTYFKRIVSDYPDSPQAKTARERIQALGGKP